jgi:DNA invertase Pin-like site-specific DNA recombinase
MATRPQRVAIYVRMSKEDQDRENQLLQLREFCERWEGHELVADYVDMESGTRGRRERKDFDRMFADAARRRFGWKRGTGSQRPLSSRPPRRS